MGSYSTINAFLCNLRDVLRQRAGLTGVTIATGPVDDVTIGQEAVVFGVDTTDGEYGRLTLPGREVFESYNVEGRIWVVKAGRDMETTMELSRQRAVEILTEVHDAFNDDWTTTETNAVFGVDHARITGWSLDQLPGDGYRDCRLSFTVAVDARFTPA